MERDLRLVCHQPWAAVQKPRATIPQETTDSAALPEVSKKWKASLIAQENVGKQREERTRRGSRGNSWSRGQLLSLAWGNSRRKDIMRRTLLCKVNQDNSLMVLANMYFEDSPAYLIQYLIHTEKEIYYLYSYLLPRVSFPSSYAKIKKINCHFGWLLFIFSPIFLPSFPKGFSPSAPVASISFRIFSWGVVTRFSSQSHLNSSIV